MLIRTITTNAEEMLLSAIESKNSGSVAKSFLQCTFSDANITPPDVDSLAIILKDLVQDNNGGLYYCNDKDIFIEWTSSTKGIKPAIEGEIAKFCLKNYPSWNPENFFHYYDISSHCEKLRIICKNKIAKLKSGKLELMPETGTKHIKEIKFTPGQYTSFYKARKTRKSREKAEVLIVEDQAFSRTLMMGILSEEYKSIAAKDGEEALLMYSSFAPDIVLLDVELPDSNGHEIAKFLRHLDPKLWIIMVTANHYQSDVLAAKENKVNGFIVKPYNKQKILEIMDSFTKSRKQI